MPDNEKDDTDSAAKFAAMRSTISDIEAKMDALDALEKRKPWRFTLMDAVRW